MDETVEYAVLHGVQHWIVFGDPDGWWPIYTPSRSSQSTPASQAGCRYQPASLAGDSQGNEPRCPHALIARAVLVESTHEAIGRPNPQLAARIVFDIANPLSRSSVNDRQPKLPIPHADNLCFHSSFSGQSIPSVGANEHR